MSTRKIPSTVSSDRDKNPKGGSKKEPIKPQDVCNALKDFVLSVKAGTRTDDSFDWDGVYKDAFVEAKQANRGKATKRGKEGNIFHHLVRFTTDWPEEHLQAVLQWLLDSSKQRADNDQIRNGRTRSSRPLDNLLREELSSGQTAMHMALNDSNEHEEFVKIMLTTLNPVPSILAEVLCTPLKLKEQTSFGANCLHCAISFDSKYKEDVFHRMKRYFDHVGPDYWHPLRMQHPGDGNTPLHLAVKKATEYSLDSLITFFDDQSRKEGLHEPKESLRLIEQLIKSYPEALEVANEGGLTPYQERIWQLSEDEDVQRAIFMVREACFRARQVSSSSEREGWDKAMLASQDKEHLKLTRRVMESARQRYGGLVPNEKMDGPGVIEIDEKQNKDLEEEASRIVWKFNELDSNQAKAVVYGSDEFRQLVIGDPVLELIRNHCIREMDREKAMKCLYPPGQELAIEFNLAGISRQSISEEYLKSFETHLRFEATLKQVVLPKLAFNEKKSRGPNSNTNLPSKIKGRADLINIFNWLRKRQVRRILKITVYDDDSPYHTDKAIIDSLQGFGVETWNWRRLDLPSEVICKASKEVRDIILYCSGNQAVLKGWSSKGGFEDPAKFPMLKTITVYLREGQEDSKTLDEYGRNFKIDIERTISESDGNGLSSDNVDYKLDRYPYGMLLAGGTGPLDENGHHRITFLKNFAVFFRNNPVNPPPSIKIAILDDGLDPSLDMLKTKYTKFEHGRAFYSSDTGDRREYYVPSSDHGARVASLICSICPYTTLYVAKLEYESTRSGQPQINISAAAKAVKWAVQRGVDIINMSWTIDCDRTGENPKELDIAIQEAEGAGIVMFCSASDQGGDSRENCYPVKYPGTIAIGSLSVDDNPSVWLQQEQVEFMLPGERITVQNNDGTSGEDSGSSLATAVATGLGGLLMYCTLILGIGSTPSMRGSGNEAQGGNGNKEFIWNSILMRQVFTNLSGAITGVQGKKLMRPEEIQHNLVDISGKKRLPSLPEQELDDSRMQHLQDIFLRRLKA